MINESVNDISDYIHDNDSDQLNNGKCYTTKGEGGGAKALTFVSLNHWQAI